MLQKLYSTVHGEVEVDNSDTPMNQEVLLPGHLYLMIFKVREIEREREREREREKEREREREGGYFQGENKKIYILCSRL